MGKETRGFHVASYRSRGAEIELMFPAKEAGPKASIIIGPNGSGKSRIVADIIDEFCLLERIRSKSQLAKFQINADKNKQTSAEVSYFFDGSNYTLKRIGTSVHARMDNQDVNFHEIPFPRKAFAVAHLPVDRFKFSKQSAGAFYSYLGLRQAGNLTTTGALEIKVLFSILRGTSNPGFSKNILNWFNMLDIDEAFSVRIGVRQPELFFSDIDAFMDFSHKIFSGRTARRIPFGDFAERYSSDVSRAHKLFVHFKAQGQLASDPRVLEARIEALLEGFDPLVLKDAFDAARRLRLIDETALFFIKRGHKVRFSELSSGEQQIIGTVTQLLAEIEDCALVAIDEPEVSLHPSWQMRYIPTLLKTFSDFTSAHFLIATHSHFMVSDVDRAHTSLVFSSNETSFQFTPFDGELYGRSPENILYRAFGVSAASNFYLEQDLEKALAMVSGRVEIDRIALEEIILRLRRLTGPDNEPMQDIVVQLENVIGG